MSDLLAVMAENIRYEMAKRNTNLAEISSTSGVSISMLSQVANQKRRPNLATIEKISTALSVQPWELLKPRVWD